MKPHRCCQRRSAARPRRLQEAARWLIPGATLALLPKCPVCLAAYIALATGLVITPDSAHHVLHALTILCLGTLAWCALRHLVKYCH